MTSTYWEAMITNELVWVYLKGMMIGLLVVLLFWAVVEFSSWGIRTLKNRGANPWFGRWWGKTRLVNKFPILE